MSVAVAVICSVGIVLAAGLVSVERYTHADPHAKAQVLRFIRLTALALPGVVTWATSNYGERIPVWLLPILSLLPAAGETVLRSRRKVVPSA